ncbi:MAG: hypothetical protein ABGZ35_26955 [Planctomycetaceae bacterium]
MLAKPYDGDIRDRHIASTPPLADSTQLVAMSQPLFGAPFEKCGLAPLEKTTRKTKNDDGDSPSSFHISIAMTGRL